MNCYSYCIRGKNGKGWGRGIAPHPSNCHQCGAALPQQSLADTGAAGYGCKDEEPAPALSTPMRDATVKLRKSEIITRSKAICYSCCAENDTRDMIDTGRAVLYLTEGPTDQFFVSNWPGSLKIEPYRVRKGAHNIAGTRYDVWFSFDGKPWHGVNIGDNQILRCKRIKHA